MRKDTGLRDAGLGYPPRQEADASAPHTIGISGDGARFGTGYTRGQVLVVRTRVGSQPRSAGPARPVAAGARPRSSRLVPPLQPRPPLGPPPLPGAPATRPGGAPRSGGRPRAGDDLARPTGSRSPIKVSESLSVQEIDSRRLGVA